MKLVNAEGWLYSQACLFELSSIFAGVQLKSRTLTMQCISLLLFTMNLGYDILRFRKFCFSASLKHIIIRYKVVSAKLYENVKNNCRDFHHFTTKRLDHKRQYVKKMLYKSQKGNKRCVCVDVCLHLLENWGYAYVCINLCFSLLKRNVRNGKTKRVKKIWKGISGTSVNPGRL